MTPISVDELPDFLVSEFPGQDLRCIADFSRDGIAIQCNGKEVAFYSERAFDENKITREALRDRFSKLFNNQGRKDH